MNTSMHTIDSFWASDLEAVEASFLGGKKVTDLAAHLDKRVPPQGRVELDRTVNVDRAVAKLLYKEKQKAAKPSLMSRIVDTILFS